MTNWGDVAINQMADQMENRRRDAQYLANADHYLNNESKHALTGIIHALREHFTSPRVTDGAETVLPLEARRKPAG